MLAATYFSTLDLARLAKSQTHPLYIRALSEAAALFGDDEKEILLETKMRIQLTYASIGQRPS